MKTSLAARYAYLEHPALKGGKVRIKLPPKGEYWLPVRAEFPKGKTQGVFTALEAAGLAVKSWKVKKGELPELLEKPSP